MGWGDIVEPSAYWEQNALHVALHPAQAKVMQADPVPRTAVNGTGHLYARLQLGELVDSLRDGALLYAENGLLRGYTAESLLERLAELESLALRVPRAELLAGYEGGKLRVVVDFQLAAP